MKPVKPVTNTSNTSFTCLASIDSCWNSLGKVSAIILVYIYIYEGRIDLLNNVIFGVPYLHRSLHGGSIKCDIDIAISLLAID